MPRAQKVRRFCWTLHDEQVKFPDVIAGIPAERLSFFVGQRERCPNTGKIHWQAYCRLSQPISFTTIKTWLPRAHIENAKGNEAQNIAYCTKEDSRVSGPYEQGDRSQQGKRKDIDTVREMVKAGKRMREIADVVSSYQGLRFAAEFIKFQPPPRRVPPIIYWVHGSTGSGKTRWAFERAADLRLEVCRILGTKQSVFFDPYIDQMFVLFDDFRPTRMPFDMLLCLTDRYPTKVRIMYGFSDWIPEVIVFTCPYTIEECFRSRCDEDIGQLTRRVEESGGRQIQFGSIVKRHDYNAEAPGFHSI